MGPLNESENVIPGREYMTREFRLHEDSNFKL